MVKERPESMKEMAVQLYNETGSAYKVASKMGVSHKAVYRMLHEKGVDVPGWNDPKPNRRKFSGAAAEAVVSDYLDGMRLVDLMSKYGSSDSAIRECVRRSGVELRTVGGRRRATSESQEAEIVALLATGMTQASVATKVGRHTTVVSKIAARNGIASRHRATKDAHGSWKGGVVTDLNGYLLERMYPEDPYYSMAPKTQYVPQHRVVMARHLGRALTKYESVHHINGDRKGNRIENLQLRYGAHGKGKVLTCRCCGSHDILAEEI